MKTFFAFVMFGLLAIAPASAAVMSEGGIVRSSSGAPVEQGGFLVEQSEGTSVVETSPAIDAIPEQSYTKAKNKSLIGGLLSGLHHQGYSYNAGGWKGLFGNWTKTVVTQEAVPGQAAKYGSIRNNRRGGNHDPNGTPGKDNGGANRGHTN